jgi:hypothetical protein
VAPGIHAGVFPPTVHELVIRNSPCFDAQKP